MTSQRWFAVVLLCGSGYALECWPDERDGYLHRLGDRILGEFDTRAEADRAVTRRLNPIRKAQLNPPREPEARRWRKAPAPGPISAHLRE
jgi:hypothetical protein